MLEIFGKIDRKLSTYIIQADALPYSLLLYPFAAFFHPQLILFPYLFVYYFSGYDLAATIIYLVGTGICLLTTTLLKKIIKRERPGLVVSTRKSHHFRTKEKNNSMPSGDAIQSALLACYTFYLGLPPLYAILFHLGVCLGRVYYMCHWLLDTFVASVLGIILAFYLNQVRLEGIVQSILQQVPSIQNL